MINCVTRLKSECWLCIYVVMIAFNRIDNIVTKDVHYYICFLGEEHISLGNLLIEKKIRESRRRIAAVTGTDVIDFLGIESSSEDRHSIAICIRHNVRIICFNK